MCKNSVAFSDIGSLRNGQAINTEVIKALSDTIVHITEALSRLEEPSKSQKNVAAHLENELNYMQCESTEQELYREKNTIETNKACTTNFLNMNKRFGQNNSDVNRQSHKQSNTKTPKHLVTCPFPSIGKASLSKALSAVFFIQTLVQDSLHKTVSGKIFSLFSTNNC